MPQRVLCSAICVALAAAGVAPLGVGFCAHMDNSPISCDVQSCASQGLTSATCRDLSQVGFGKICTQECSP